MNGSQPRALDVVSTAFAWFNDVGARRAPLTREGVARHFHPQASIQIDTVMKGVGVEGFYRRFEQMLAQLKWWNVSQPFQLSLSEGDRAAAHYQYRYETKEGADGFVDVVSIWTVKDGKVLETIENASYHGASVKLDSFT